MPIRLGCRGLGARAQQPPDLGRQYIFVARHCPQRVADTPFRLPVAVKGCAVDIAHAPRPSRPHDPFGFLAGHRHPVTTEGRAAEPENSYLERGAPEAAFLETRHIVISLFAQSSTIFC